MRCLLTLAMLFGLAWSLSGRPADTLQILDDAGFEDARPGRLESTTTGKGWEVQRVGWPRIQDRLIVECLADGKQARTGNHVLRLAIPKDTVGFEFVTVGQRHRLKVDREYEASVWVRWLDGPEKAPQKADATSGHPSAIVSFWARHREAEGDFARRDVWLFDRQWKQLPVRFRASDPEQRTLVYVSLLPNQKGVPYAVQCRIRWDSHTDGPTAPIVNYGMYHEETNTWYGPVDQTLKKSRDWETYRFVHASPFGGKWKLYVQVNGWGNFGNQLTISVDDLTCRPVR